MSTVIIGQIIKRRIETVGMSKAEVARRMNMSPANIHKIFKRNSLDIEMLRQFGMILGYDFISHYHYLTANAISGTRAVSASAHTPVAVSIYSLQKKITHVLQASRQLITTSNEKPTYLVTDIDFLLDILHDMSLNHPNPQ